MDGPDRELAERFHTIVTDVAPELEAKTWYGMPAYAKDGTTLCFFQAAGKFNVRYATIGFQHNANLDDETWPTAFCGPEPSPTNVDARVRDLVAARGRIALDTTSEPSRVTAIVLSGRRAG